MTTVQPEIEDTYDVPESFVVPSLADLGEVRTSDVGLRSEYFDTADGRLLAHRITLRRRTGDTDEGWQLKVPAAGRRDEIRLPLSGTGVPEGLRDLLVGVATREPLQTAAVIETVRRRHQVMGPDGGVLAEIADDHVRAVVPGGAVRIATWREVEVELGTAGRRLLRTIGARLTAAGAVPAAVTSKLARAVGAATAGDDDGAARAAVRAYVTEQIRAVVAGDIAQRRGDDAVHDTRVAARRLRSALRVFGHVFEPAAAAGLEAELRWFTAEWGVVRDAQVQAARHRTAIGRLPREAVMGPVMARWQETSAASSARARAALTEAMAGDRYSALFVELARWRTDPPFAAIEPRRRDLVAMVRHADRTARRRLRHAARDGDDVAWHRARKAAKRARYAAELGAPILGGKPARRLRHQHQRVQQVLGDHQDAVVASDLVRRLGAATAGVPDENGFAFGVLWQQERDRAATARRRATRLAR